MEARAKDPVIPLSIFRNRTVTLTTVASLFVGVAMFAGTVFLSQYFQIALGKSPTVVSLMSLPMIGGLLVSSTVAGQLISRTGKWKGYLVAGGVTMTVGLALLSTIGADTHFGLLSLYMAILGIGVGMLMQNLVLAAQNDVPAQDLGTATSVLSFFRSLGGTVGVSVLGAILANRVASEMTKGLGDSRHRPGGRRRPRRARHDATPGCAAAHRGERLRGRHRRPVPDLRAVRRGGPDRRPLHQGEAAEDHQRHGAAPRRGGGRGRVRQPAWTSPRTAPATRAPAVPRSPTRSPRAADPHLATPTAPGGGAAPKKEAAPPSGVKGGAAEEGPGPAAS